jgi:hypothetical protein
MMRRYLVCVGLAALTTFAPVVQAQSLVDVARNEEARRKALKQPVPKVITNDDLKAAGDPPASSGPASSTPAPSPAPAPAPAPADSAATDQRNEKFWHDRITAARTALDHDKVLVDAVQSRINALTTDFVNTADPAQRAVVDTNRTMAMAELARLNKDIQTQTKAITDIQEEARKASVPSGWLR